MSEWKSAWLAEKRESPKDAGSDLHIFNIHSPSNTGWTDTPSDCVDKRIVEGLLGDGADILCREQPASYVRIAEVATYGGVDVHVFLGELDETCGEGALSGFVVLPYMQGQS